MSTEVKLKRTTKQRAGRKVPFNHRAIVAATLISTSMAPLLSSCGLSSSENTILVRVQGTPGIPYEVKLDAGNDTDVQRGNGDDAFTFTTDDCLISVSVNSDQSDTLYVGLWINDEYDDRDTSSSGYVSVSGSCL
jgi:hypothetical protein